MENLVIYNDNYTITPELSLYFLEMNVTLNTTTEKERLFNLFNYFVSRGYNQPASDIIDYMIRKNIIVKPL